MTRRLAAVTLAALTLILGLLAGTASAHAAAMTPGQRMLNWAKANAAGHWYAWGGTGLSTYDCSGLVFRSAVQTGVRSMPRDTYSMLAAGVASGLLRRTYAPVAGDLAFYGTGHVEIVDYGHDVTFGAQQTGTRVGDHAWNGWWRPTAFYRVL